MNSVCLVGKDTIVKEGLKGILEKASFKVAADCQDAEVLCERPLDGADASIIINIDTGEADIADAVRRQKDLFPQSRVVILSSRKDIPVIAAAFSTGADGYILKDVSTDALMGSLRLVLSGEKVFPTSMLSRFAQGGVPAPANSQREPGTTPLSERELGILRHLSAGDSNKAIALSLNLREATVKTHVKKILRKLGAANRTQAAVWAIEHGYQEPVQNGRAE
jgi:two-component system, NarL family, nitrate/nitrite response regulator NarL